MVEDLGLEVHCDARTKAFEADAEGRVSKVTFETEGWDDLDVGIVVVSAGIRPRDEVARDAVECHERGGVVVSDTLQTSDKDVYAVGEVALHGGMIYGLVAPGYAMAEVAADHLVADLLGEMTLLRPSRALIYLQSSSCWVATSRTSGKRPATRP